MEMKIKQQSTAKYDHGVFGKTESPREQEARKRPYIFARTKI